MKLDHIKDLLLITCHFNTSSITHTFAIEDSENTLKVKCIKDTFILEITSSGSHKVEYHTSIDEAAESLFSKIYSTDLP